MTTIQFNYAIIIKVLVFLFTFTESYGKDASDLCTTVAKKFELENNVTVTASNSGLSHGIFIISIQNGKGKYGKMTDRCVITINQPCTAFFQCAGNKAKLIKSLFTTRVNDKYGILMIDGDSAVKSSSYLRELYNTNRISSYRPDSRRWSTAGMYWPINSLRTEDISILLRKLEETGRDDVAFQTIKVKRINGLNEDFIHHARGNDIFGKNALQKVSVSSFLNNLSIILIFAYYVFQEPTKTRFRLKNTFNAFSITLMLVVLDKCFGLFIIYMTKGISSYPLANDSRFNWYNSVSTPLSICWQNTKPIVRQNLYGPFYEASIPQSYLLLIYLVAKDFGLSILLFTFFKPITNLKLGRKRLKRYSVFLLSFTAEIIFTALSIFLFSMFWASMKNIWYWHDSKHFYGILSTCSGMKCAFTGPANLIRAFLYQTNHLILPFGIVPYYLNYPSSNHKRLNRLISFLVVCLLIIGNLTEIKPEKASQNAKICSSKITKIGENKEFVFNVTLPCDMTLLEGQKFVIGENSMNAIQVSGDDLHPSWKKVALLKALCRHKDAPKSAILYDNEIPEFDGITNSLLGGKTKKHAELIEDPKDSKSFLSSVGRFSLNRCSFIYSWGRTAGSNQTGTVKTAKIGLNEVIKGNKGISIGRNMVNFKHTSSDTNSIAIQPVKTSIYLTDYLAWVILILKRFRKKTISHEDVLIFGVIGLISSPKFTLNRDLIMRGTKVIPENPFITQWIPPSHQVVWSPEGIPVKITDYSKVIYTLSNDYFSYILYFFGFISITESIFSIFGMSSVVDLGMFKKGSKI